MRGKGPGRCSVSAAFLGVLRMAALLGHWRCVNLTLLLLNKLEALTMPN